MKIGIVDPYFDAYGGGESYMLTLACHLSAKYDVTVFWDDINMFLEAQKRFGIDVSKIKITQNVFRGTSLLKKSVVTRQYDCIIFLTDGSIPFSLANRNILHIQVPCSRLSFPIWKRVIYSDVVFNSEFTKFHSDRSVWKKSTVIYPPVSTADIKPQGKREKIILSVGRFSPYHSVKKQDVLIDAFTRAKKEGKFSGFTLVLAGGMGENDREFFRSLKDKARDLPIRFYPNIGRSDLVHLYGSAKIYWHAAGFGETDPSLMEHFGISTVEAMAGGCAVLSYKAGGQEEIITEGTNGFLWNSTKELLDKTDWVIRDESLYGAITKAAGEKAREYSVQRFGKSWDAVIGGTI